MHPAGSRHTLTRGGIAPRAPQAEFTILPHLVASGVIGYFTELDIEWHDGFLNSMAFWPDFYTRELGRLGIRYSAHE